MQAHNICICLKTAELKWFFLQNGDILHDNISLNHQEYCFEAISNNKTNRSDLKLWVCYDPDPSDWIEPNHFDFLSYGSYISGIHRIKVKFLIL